MLTLIKNHISSTANAYYFEQFTYIYLLFIYYNFITRKRALINLLAYIIAVVKK